MYLNNQFKKIEKIIPSLIETLDVFKLPHKAHSHKE